MKLRIDKWRHYLVALTAIVVVATGLAATPLRKSLAPFVSKPLGSWSLPVARPSGQASASTEFHAGSATATRIDELGGIAALPDSTLARNGADLVDLGDVTEHGAGGQSSRDGGDSRQSGNWNLDKSGSGKSFGFSRSGSVGYSARSGFSGSSSIGRGTGKSSGGSGSGGGNGSAGSGSGGGSAREERGDGSIFKEHNSGFPELTGRKKHGPGSGGASGGGKPNLSSNPEPSTLILFGTGFVTAVGTIRRRLRRQ